ncbi:cytochrome P450 [Aurantimonas aggregata]|uniref:Cytochrome P450 n=1 Tax=Aurantimonas aggregata TaxID=2047720 RepID=A0A6L9MJE7_9HYPH|nr:cytochrome P450 [Aurantimonas aggregata]NDV87959.1 cytochrome P450 [Aurantimonas aggregata]
MTDRPSLPSITAAESAGFLANVGLPTLAKGVIIRRPSMVGLASRMGLDARAVRFMQSLRDRHGSGPVLIRNPVRTQAVLLSAQHVRRVLEGSPDPFSPASSEKRAALSHFEPHSSLVTEGPERQERRRFNDTVLASKCPIHPMAPAFTAIVEEEVAALLRVADPLGELSWDIFFESWMRIVRRVFLGDGAAGDTELTAMINRLRGRANWAFAVPENASLREAFHRRLQSHLDRGDAGSLASLAGGASAGENGSYPSHQVAQWLFAADPAGMSIFRTLALLAVHHDKLDLARAEIEAVPDAGERSYLRAAVVETLRLYPTTPMILRQSTRVTEWEEGILPAGAGILIYTPFFHRDPARLPEAHRFCPEMWLERDPGDMAPLVPFSAGPGVCPARHLVPLLGSAVMAALLRKRQIRLLRSQDIDPHKPLPGTLDNYSMVFGITP